MQLGELIGEKTRTVATAVVTAAAVVAGATVVGVEVVRHEDAIVEYLAGSQLDPNADAKQRIAEAMMAPVVQSVAAGVINFVNGQVGAPAR